MPIDIEPLRYQIQRNCHIADARHAADFTLCIYLLKMREYYRWEQCYPFDTPLPSEEVGDWLRQREELWESLEDSDYTPISLDNSQHHPFESDSLNRHLVPHGYLYSGGIGRKRAAHFFLGELLDQQQEADYQLLITGKEYARDLTAPPAMSQGQTIYIRRESLRRLIWEKLQEWRWNPCPTTALARAFSGYDFDHDLEGSLEAMTDHELPQVVQHEIGEIRAGQLLGPEWEEMLLKLSNTPEELIARAVRDHLADALTTLPHLLEQQQVSSLHFYMANLSSLRKRLFPSLERAYHGWLESSSLQPFQALINQSQHHWLQHAKSLLNQHLRNERPSASKLEALIQARQL